MRHVLTADGLRPDAEKIKAIKNISNDKQCRFCASLG